MADPERALTLRSVNVPGLSVPADTLVWVLRREPGWAHVEHGDRQGRVSQDALAPYPVQAPTVEQLRSLDPCFGLPEDSFEREHIDRENFFEILRCRAHGQRFLRDTRGTVASCTRLTLLQDTDDEDPNEVWMRYHRLSDAWLLLQGRTL